MPKFYVYYNASRRIKSGEFEYSFDPIEQFGGAWVGVLKLEDEAMIAELDKFSSRLGIKEITPEVYEEWLKKKQTFSRFSANIPDRPKGHLSPHAGVVVKSPTARSIVEDNRPSSDEAVLVGKAEFIDPIMGRVKNTRFARSWQ